MQRTFPLSFLLGANRSTLPNGRIRPQANVFTPLFRSALVISFFLVQTISFSQAWVIPVDGKVFANNDKLSGSVVTLYKNGTQMQQVVTTSNGKFSFELVPNAEYLIAITKPGFITKKFKVNTANVPADRADAGNFNPFQPDVTLFEMPSAPEISKRVEAILSQPIAIYQYIPSENNFNYDQKYSDAVQTKLSELAGLQKQVEKEMADKVKAAAMEAQKQMELDKKYKAAIDKADKAFGSKEYVNAKAGYTEASGLKPAEAYPKQKLAEIDKLIADAANVSKQKDIDDKYKTAIAKGDAAFGTKDYTAAKTGYTEASGIKPAEAYPKQKLAEIDKLIADAGKQKEIDDKYKTAIAKGDAALGKKDYTAAKAGYTEASGIKPAEAYPKQKLAEIDKLIADAANASKQKEIDDKYKAAIAKGDAAFGTKDYTTAKAGYTDALGIKPAEAYPKTKLAEIDKLLADAGKQKEIDDKYKAAIAKGDGALGKKDYTTAKAGYTEALGIKPAEAYPKQKLAEIDKLIADAANASKQKEIDDKYKAAITKGDNAFNTKDYTTAKAGYTDASGIKPTEQYPKTKLAEIDKLVADAANASKQKEIDDKYKAAIAKGDAAFDKKDYIAAKTGYTDASGIKPAEAYPKQKLAEIDKLLASAVADKQKEQQYKDLIAKGDAAFGTKDYAGAKSSYTQASALKTTEQYPKTKIAEIDKLLVEMSKAGELDKQYKDLIAKGDNFFTQKNYTSARSSYSDASSLKSSEQYPKTKIAEIDKLLADIASQKSAAEKDQQYKDAVAKADKFLASKDYSNAKTEYNNALGIKPAEQYPKTKIAEIDKLLSAASSQKEIDDKYKAAIAKGDAAFGTKDYIAAKAGYTEASGIKPTEQYPKTKLAEIDKLVAGAANAAKQKEIDDKYKSAIAKGDAAFDKKDYTAAKTGYTEASGIKPAEAYPKQKIAEIDKLLSAASSQKETDEKYKAAIAKGDNAFTSKDYSTAKTSYNEALGIKPAEQYPKQKLTEIDALMKNLSAQEQTKKYNDALARGAKNFGAKDYSSAKSDYQEASGIKPTEQFPKDKIAEIDKLLKAVADKQSAAQAVENSYLAAVARGDAAFKENTFANAKAAYNEALTYKPNEKYPKDKLSEIAQIEKARGQAQLDKDQQQKYNTAISKGDIAFAKKDYPLAKSGYEEALSYKSAEKYPKDRLKQIADLLKGSQTTQTVKKNPPVSAEEKKKQYQSELRSKYPPGVTEEEFVDGNKTILRRVVIRDDYAGVYTRTTYNWGGIYYQKDNDQITEVMFEGESK